MDEILVVGDGWNDKAVGVGQKHFDERVSLISLPNNRGKQNTLLAGADDAKNDVLLFLDTDLKGLEPVHIQELIRPVKRGNCQISIGLFGDGRWRTNIRYNLVPFLSGQRWLRWSLFNRLYRRFINGWSIEKALSLQARFKKYPVTYVMWQGVTHAIRTEKRGLLAGCWSYLKMGLEIGKYVYHFVKQRWVTN